MPKFTKLESNYTNTLELFLYTAYWVKITMSYSDHTLPSAPHGSSLLIQKHTSLSTPTGGMAERLTVTGEGGRNGPNNQLTPLQWRHTGQQVWHLRVVPMCTCEQNTTIPLGALRAPRVDSNASCQGPHPGLKVKPQAGHSPDKLASPF